VGTPWPADDARPLVLISFSTAPQGQAGALQHTLTALSTLPVRGLVTLGPALDPAQFQAPANVVLESFVPHALVLPQVAVMVSQCGHGTVMQALAHGVPLVCLPLRGDQPDIAARVVYAGAGVRLSQDATPAQIRAALQRVLADPSYHDGARRIARAMTMEDGTRTAVEEIESLIAPMGSQAPPAC